MDKAKASVKGFLSKDGKHDTTVHETVNPAIQNEKVHRTQREELQTVVDREVHQDHHHTSVQPIQDREVLPEEHTHNMGSVEHRKINHGNDSHVKERLATEAAQFKNTREVGETHHTKADAGVVTGEHVHHHVHEHIQPVIQKETIQPSVVHTTVPVHEVHQNEAKHHTATALPAVTMDQFRSQGGSLSGREERTDAFAGEPKAVGGTLGGKGAHGTTSLTENDRAGHGHNGLTGSSHTGTTGGLTGSSHNETHNGTHNGTHTGTTDGLSGSHTGTNTSTTGKKVSLLDKLNPMKDADGDGKKGLMD